MPPPLLTSSSSVAPRRSRKVVAAAAVAAAMDSDDDILPSAFAAIAQVEVDPEECPEEERVDEPLDAYEHEESVVAATPSAAAAATIARPRARVAPVKHVFSLMLFSDIVLNGI
jgi:hypothetical protein